MIEYQKILDKNMLNVFKDILNNIKDKDILKAGKKIKINIINQFN